MRGYRNDPLRSGDFAAPDEMIGHSYPNQPVPELDAKDERLLWLADKNGYLTGRNSVLENVNYDLSRRLQEMEKENEQLHAETKELRNSRDDFREKYYEADREVDRLRQYEPEKPAESEDQE